MCNGCSTPSCFVLQKLKVQFKSHFVAPYSQGLQNNVLRVKTVSLPGNVCIKEVNDCM